MDIINKYQVMLNFWGRFTVSVERMYIYVLFDIYIYRERTNNFHTVEILYQPIHILIHEYKSTHTQILYSLQIEIYNTLDLALEAHITISMLTHSIGIYITLLYFNLIILNLFTVKLTIK